MSTEEIKNRIRRWVKRNGRIVSDIGEIAIGEPIAEGGTALVFASDFAGGTAIKFLAESVSARSTRYERFLSEYVNLVRLVPTGVVVPLYYFAVQHLGGDVRVPYIVMERCVKTLDTQYSQDRLTDEAEFRTLLNRLLTVLEVIHDAGIVHRDFKPKNILQRSDGDWVLGDFGISWFDPGFYVKLAQTRKSDRLANWGFSAPEQFRRDAYDRATPCLDLYALGQTLYYCVSGRWIAGPGYPRFAQLAPQLSLYDPVINKLVRQEPSERFQSVSQVCQFLAGLKQDSQFDRDARRLREMIRQVSEFDLRLRRSVPGSSGYYQAKGKGEINRVLESLAEGCDSYDLWWTKGREHSPASPLRKLSKDIWLIWCFECEIVDLWVWRHPTLERQYVVVHLAPRPPFGFLDLEGREKDAAGYFEGRYVDPNMLFDGHAEIDGEIVEVAGAEERWRNLRDDFLILAPNISVCNDPANDRWIDEIYHSLVEAGMIHTSVLEPLEQLPRAYWMYMFD